MAKIIGIDLGTTNSVAAVVRGGELSRSVAQALALVRVPAFVFAREVFQDPAVAAAHLENPRARGDIVANKTIGEVVLIDLEITDRGIGIARIVGLERQVPKQREMGQLRVREISKIAGMGPVGIVHKK